LGAGADQVSVSVRRGRGIGRFGRHLPARAVHHRRCARHRLCRAVVPAPLTFAWAYMGTTPGIKAFAAAIFGGLENPIGILIGGLVIGLLEQVFGIINSNLKEGITFLFILIVLAISPTGLMGRREITKV